MTLRFILDENVVILAQERIDDHGRPDQTCFDLLDGIIKICYPIVSDSNLWGKYHHQLSNRPIASPGSPHVLAILASALRREGKIDWQANASDFPDETAIQQHGPGDVEIVRLAVATGAILVTTDYPLLTDLETAGIRERYNLQVVSPDAALPLL